MDGGGSAGPRCCGKPLPSARGALGDTSGAGGGGGAPLPARGTARREPPRPWLREVTLLLEILIGESGEGVVAPAPLPRGAEGRRSAPAPAVSPVSAAAPGPGLGGFFLLFHGGD